MPHTHVTVNIKAPTRDTWSAAAREAAARTRAAHHKVTVQPSDKEGDRTANGMTAKNHHDKAAWHKAKAVSLKGSASHVHRAGLHSVTAAGHHQAHTALSEGRTAAANKHAASAEQAETRIKALSH